MKAIRISDEAYDFLKYKSIQEKRSLIQTLDLFVKVFKDEEEHLEKESISPSPQKSVQEQKMANSKKKNT